MQDPIIQNEQDALHSSEEPSPISREPTAPGVLEPAELHPPNEALTNEPPASEIPSSSPHPNPHAQRHAILPHRGLYYTALAGVIAGVLAALLTIVITLVNTGTFYTARQQIAADRLTVKTALALAAWEILAFALSLLIGFVLGMIVGRIAVRRRLGFLAGALAGAVFSLITFLLSLIASYPGNLSVNGTTITTGSLVISLLFLCLWSIGGGLVSLCGTWVVTVRHPYYLSRG
ncbi:MAG TPA: YrzE family protein [Ktedonobacteraceae bacterium]